MKMCKIKKAAAVLLAMCMICGAVTVAADEQPELYSDRAVSAEAGGVFTLPVYIKNNPGITGFVISIKYDEKVVEPVSDSEIKGDIVPVIVANSSYLNKPETRVASVHYENCVGDGMLFSYDFRIKEGADAGETAISIEVSDDGGMTHLEEDLSVSKIKCAGSSVKIAISGASQAGENTAPDRSPSPKPEDDPAANSPSMVAFILKSDAAQTKYISPVSENLFEPDRAATRYEVVEALYELLDFVGLEESDRFSDVDEAHREIVNAFAQTPIIDGYEDGSFKGENRITRAEFIKILSVAIGNAIDFTIKTEFPDVDPSHWASSYIASFANSGNVVGYEDGTFGPENDITRAEVTAIINRSIKMAKAADAQQVFEDLVPEHWAFGDIMAGAKLPVGALSNENE